MEPERTLGVGADDPDDIAASPHLGRFGIERPAGIDGVAEGVQAVSGAKVRLIQVGEAEAHEPELDAADAIIFGSPTYMGGVSADFAKFKDWTAARWMEGMWRDKLAAGFTVSASWAATSRTH